MPRPHHHPPDHPPTHCGRHPHPHWGRHPHPRHPLLHHRGPPPPPPPGCDGGGKGFFRPRWGRHPPPWHFRGRPPPPWGHPCPTFPTPPGSGVPSPASHPPPAQTPESTSPNGKELSPLELSGGDPCAPQEPVSVSTSPSGAVGDGAGTSDTNVQNEFLCPITMEIMKDPVIAADGFTYERSAITEWLETGNVTSPMTNLPLPYLQLLPNRALKTLILRHLEQAGQ